MPPGETQINDICLSDSGYSLFSAAADKVRIKTLLFIFIESVKNNYFFMLILRHFNPSFKQKFKF